MRHKSEMKKEVIGILQTYTLPLKADRKQLEITFAMELPTYTESLKFSAGN